MCKSVRQKLGHTKILAISTLKVNYLYNTFRYPIYIYSVCLPEFLACFDMYVSTNAQCIRYRHFSKIYIYIHKDLMDWLYPLVDWLNLPADWLYLLAD